MAATLCLDSLPGDYQSRVQVNINNGTFELRKTLPGEGDASCSLHDLHCKFKYNV